MKYNASYAPALYTMVRTRIAPSPTGNPHIGTMYQALFNYAYARKHEGTFVVRIEDTDQARKVEGAEEQLFAALDWFGISEDESIRNEGEYGPYKQSERLDRYKRHAEQLVSEGKAYYCDCSKERLDEVRKALQAEKKTPMYDRHCRDLNKTAGVIRMKIPDNATYTWMDGIRGEMTFSTTKDGYPLVDDQVIMKSDGFPTYHLAVVIDDHEMGITHLVRGEEWIASTPKHVILYDYFGWKDTMPLLTHTPLLRNPDKSKLSKRHGHTDVRWYRDAGFLPEALFNFMALLGWSHPEEKEIFSLDEFIEYFDLKDLHTVGPIFDETKLRWMNGEYIRKMNVTELSERIKLFYAEKPEQGMSLEAIPHSDFIALVELAQSRIDTFDQFYPLIEHFLPGFSCRIETEQDEAVVQSLLEQLSGLEVWDAQTILEALRVVLKTNSIRMPVLYTILTGKERGLPLPESLAILGKDTIIARLSLS